MKKILFITDRNILTTCGELRLIKNRAKALYDEWGITTDFIAVAKKQRIVACNEKMEFPCNIKTIERTLNIWNIVSQIKKEIRKVRFDSEYSVIILSGLFMECLVPYIRKTLPHITIFSDIHGATEDILEVKKNKVMLNKIMLDIGYKLEEIVLKKYLCKVDGIFAVSNALKEYLDKKYHTSRIRAYIVPCASNAEKINMESYKSNRFFYRKKFKIEDSEQLFIYSGGTSPWQCIDETITIYKKIKEQVPNIKMLFLSHNIDYFYKEELKKYDIMIDSYSANEVGKVLCAGDFAFLLRKNSLTNNVAFPNKFLEYVQSGMRIITTNYINDVSRQVIKYHLGIIIEPEKSDLQELIAYISKDESLSIVNRNDVLRINGFKNRLSSFYNDIFLKENEEQNDEL